MNTACSALVWASVLTLVACMPGQSGGSAKSAGTSTGPSLVAANVNGTQILVEDVEVEAIDRGLIREGEHLDTASPRFRQLLDELIDQKLLALEAASRGLDDSPEARKRLALARERILSSLLVEQLVASAVSDASVERMYREQIKLRRGSEEVRARQILLATQEDALAARKRLINGESFEQVAFSASLDQNSRLEGGDLGYLKPVELPGPFGQALNTTQVGSISQPFKTEKGWHVVRVDDRRAEELPSLAEMRAELMRFMTFDQIQKTLEKLRGQARIDVVTDEDAGVDLPPETIITGQSPAASASQAPAAPSGEGTAPVSPPPAQPATNAPQTP